MSENCTHNCSTCGESCSMRTAPQSFLESLNQYSSVKKAIGIVSGKGGVGKSLVTSLLAVQSRREGFNTAIMDADVTGPSIPKIFGLKQKAQGSDMGILPVRTKTGIDVISLNLLLDDETKPVVWRGPIIAGMVKQFWTDVVWHNIDYMFIDMPPGTGDVPLTVFQSIPVDGIIIVTSPQELVSLIVEKAVNMAKLMNIKVLGIVENMSYFECPDCKAKHSIFGESHIEETAAKFGIDTIARLPMVPEISSVVDKGLIELVEDSFINNIEPIFDKIKA
jgi:Mrp family chromosome partitioning ATPase